MNVDVDVDVVYVVYVVYVDISMRIAGYGIIQITSYHWDLRPRPASRQVSQ